MFVTTQRKLRRLLRLVPLALLGTFAAAPCFGQATMPAGWEQLSAQDFVDAAEAMFDASPGPAADHARAVIEHGWTSFLNDAQFIASADGDLVRQMVIVISGRRGQRIDEDTTAEQVAADLATLNERVSARLAAEPGLLTSTTYEDMVANFFFQYHADVPHPQRIEPIGQYVATQDWQSLNLRQKSWLWWYLNTADRLDPKKFSVRWTGQITAPTTDQYTFSVLRQPYIDGAFKLWIDGQLVLDTSAAVARDTGEEAPEVQEPPAADDQRFQSQSMAMTAGQPVSIRAELVYDYDALKRHRIFPERMFPMAVLVWEAPSLEKQIVATDAYTPPQGFGEAGAKGLRGEYFNDVTHTESVGAFLDPGLQWIWSEWFWNDGSLLSIYRESQDAILADARPQLVNEANLAAIAAEDRAPFVRDIVVRFIRGMTARDRILLIDRLADHPELIQELRQVDLEILFQHTFMLPGQQHLKLLALWGTQHDPPPTQIAHYPGTFPDGFQAVNYFSYGGLTNWLWDLEKSDAADLLAAHLERQDGSCNLTVAYLLAQTTRRDLDHKLLSDKLDDKLADEELTGDARVAWLLARAYAAETHEPGELIRPHYAFPYLEEAELHAESDAWKFRVKQEFIARLIALDRAEQAAPLIQAAAAAFTQPAQQAAIADWQAKAAEYTAYYEQLRKDSAEAQAAAAREAHLEELQRRMNRATEAGNTALADRYRARLEAAGVELEEE